MVKSSSPFSSDYTKIYSSPDRPAPPSLSGASDRRHNTNIAGIRSESGDGSILPTLLFPVRMITSAFQDAREIDPDTGNPSEEARSAFRWLMYDPKSRYRTEPGTFSAYCAQLGPGYDPQTIRMRGTPIGSSGYKSTLGGIAAIRQVWNKAKFEWYISGGPKRLAAQEALLEQIKLQKRARETGQMVLDYGDCCACSLSSYVPHSYLPAHAE